MNGLDDLIRLVYDKSGITLDDSKEYLLRSRLEPIAKLRNVELKDLARLAKVNMQLANEIVEAMTTNETSFFRDVTLWKALQFHVLPDISRDALAQGRPALVWSAACSTGQEAYSLAILCKEIGTRVLIHGTDISPDVVTKAQSGRYVRMEVNRGLPARRLLGHFIQLAGDVWQLNPDICATATFQVANLLDRPIGHSYDLILLRNVLIYFDEKVRLRVFNHIYGAMRPGGYLLLGSSESLLSLPSGFERGSLEGTTVWRRKSA